MTAEKLLDFYNHIEKFDDYNYLMATIRFNVAPTASGKKPGTMLNLKDGSRKLASIWNEYRDEITKHINLKCYEFKSSSQLALTYFYNDRLLDNVLAREDVKNYLFSLGYGQSLEREEYFKILREKFKSTCPHEVGIFLGYPLEDVRDFVDCKGKKDLKCTGYWQCYNNREFAENTFKIFDMAKLEEINKLILETPY